MTVDAEKQQTDSNSKSSSRIREIQSDGTFERSDWISFVDLSLWLTITLSLQFVNGSGSGTKIVLDEAEDT